MKQLKTDVYLVLEPKYGTYYHNKDDIVSFSVVKMTKNRPDKATGPVVKINLEIPDIAFKPSALDLQVQVPAGYVDHTPSVKVQIEDLKDLSAKLS